MKDWSLTFDDDDDSGDGDWGSEPDDSPDEDTDW